jgi:hypothetical protein
MLVCLNLLSSELNIGDMPNFEGIIIGPFYIKKAFGGGGGSCKITTSKHGTMAFLRSQQRSLGLDA